MARPLPFTTDVALPSTPALARALRNFRQAVERGTGTGRSGLAAAFHTGHDEALGLAVYLRFSAILPPLERGAYERLLRDTEAHGHLWSPGLDWVARGYERTATPMPSELRSRIERMGEWAYSEGRPADVMRAVGAFHSARLLAELAQWIDTRPLSAADLSALADRAGAMFLWRSTRLTQSQRDGVFQHAARAITAAGFDTERETENDGLMSYLGALSFDTPKLPSRAPLAEYGGALVHFLQESQGQDPTRGYGALLRRVTALLGMPGLDAETVRGLVTPWLTEGADFSDGGLSMLGVVALRQGAIPSDLAAALLRSGARLHDHHGPSTHLFDLPDVRSAMWEAPIYDRQAALLLKHAAPHERAAYMARLIAAAPPVAARLVHAGGTPPETVLADGDLLPLLSHTSGPVRMAGVILSDRVVTAPATRRGR